MTGVRKESAMCGGGNGSLGTVSSWSMLLIMMVGMRVRDGCGTNMLYDFYYIAKLSVLSVCEWCHL